MPPSKKLKPLHEFESVALLFQGGGALGAYQCGVYEALHEADMAPDWVAGISIGALNAAIIAGNRPEERLDKLRGFWEQVTGNPLWNHLCDAEAALVGKSGNHVRTAWNQMNALASALFGAPGFFTPRLLPPWLSQPGTAGAVSLYDTSALKATLHRFIDFDILNSGAVRYSTSAVNIRTGNYATFDTLERRIGPEHVMASGALPPALPAVDIEGEYYWDGGLISNTPLQMVMDTAQVDTLAFQVDLWSSRGELPQDMAEVLTRQKEIQYSSRTRAVTDKFKHAQKMRHAFISLYERLPEKLKQTEEAKILASAADYNVYNVVQLIYRARHYEGYAKDYEFSRLSMQEHWRAGYNDTVRTLRHPGVLKKPNNPEGIATYDVAED